MPCKPRPAGDSLAAPRERASHAGESGPAHCRLGDGPGGPRSPWCLRVSPPQGEPRSEDLLREGQKALDSFRETDRSFLTEIALPRAGSASARATRAPAESRPI